jgi:hypothetical protein
MWVRVYAASNADGGGAVANVLSALCADPPLKGTMPKVGRRTVDDRADPRRLAAASTFTHGNR